MTQRQLECRIVILHYNSQFELGMYDPLNERYEKLGLHPKTKIAKIVGDLRTSVERAGHRVSFCERTG